MSTPEVTPSLPAAAPTVTPEMKQAALKMAVEARLKAAASWFYWIAALSLINTIVVMAGGKVRFIIGMGITEIVDALAKQAGGIGLAAGLVINVFVAAVCAGFGVLGMRRKTWALWLGMALYSLDGLLLVLFQDWLSVAFHGYALYRIYQGLPAIKLLEKLEPKATPGVISSSSPMG